MTISRNLALLLILGLFAAAAPGEIHYSITAAVLEGDSVDGVGLVTLINNLAINNDGDWVVEADTDHANTDADSVMLRSGVLFLREGDPVTAPAGATLDSFDSVNINNLGNNGWNFFLDGTSGSSDDSGVYFKTELVLQESTISGAPEFTPGTPYIGFFDVKINDADDLHVVASIDDPNISSSVDRALVIWELDNTGALVSESVLLKEADLLDGDAINDFGTGPHQTAFNNNGDVMFFADIGADSATDGYIGINLVKLAREGEVSPDPLRNYATLSSRGLDLNDHGDHIYKADLDGDTLNDYILVRDGEIYRREGQTLPDITPFVFDGTSAFGSSSGPIQIDHCGNVFYFGDWNDANTDIDSGLFLGEQLLVQEGVSDYEGVPYDTINSGSDAFVLSDSGQYAIFEATLDDGTNGAFIIEFERCADFDANGTVDLSDLARLLAAYNTCIGDDFFDCDVDLNFDGCVNLSDLGALLALFGISC